MRRTLALFGAMALWGWACGGGGSGGGGGGPTPPQPSVTFQGSGSGADSVSMAHGNPGSQTSFRLVVRANSVTDLYGVAFDLVFPATLLQFEGGAEGAFLGQGSTNTTFQVVQNAPGRLVVGLSRLGNAPGASGSGDLLEIEFQVIGAGTGSLSFENRQGFDSGGGPMSSLQWFGGTLTVVR